VNADSMRLLLVDNYDSFTWNLAHLFGGIDGVEVDVVRNDDAWLEDGVTARYDGVIVGPGPGRPADAGRTMAIVREAARERRPLFGVCLGLQAIGEAFGGRVVHAPAQMHGKTSRITRSRRRGITRWSSITTAFRRRCARTRSATTASSRGSRTASCRSRACSSIRSRC